MNEQLSWLKINSGPIIIYRVEKDIEHSPLIDTELKNLLSSNLVQKWLSYLKPQLEPSQIHNSKSDSYENVMGKLFEFGLRAGMKPLDEKTLPFIRWLETENTGKSIDQVDEFYQILVAAFLIMTGYHEFQVVNELILDRLEKVYSFAKKKDLSEVYVSNDDFKGLPKAWRNRKLVNPEISSRKLLPWIHDLNAWLHSPEIMDDRKNRDKLEVIIEFILTPEYQSLEPGYGIIYEENTKRYYSAGWSVHLSGYFPKKPEFSRSLDYDKFNLLRLKMLSLSEVARKHPWFKTKIDILGNYCHEGLYRFPRSWLPEKKIGYWVTGNRMGLEENRRTKNAVISESTFRYLEISKNLGNSFL